MSDRSDMEQLRNRAVLREHRFRSAFPFIGPLIAWFRHCWNSISTQWYVRPLSQQQSEFNQLLVQQLGEMRTLLEHPEARLADLVSRLERQEARLTDLVSQLRSHTESLQGRLRDHEAWLITQDREQSDLVRDVAELRVRLTQMQRLVQELRRPDEDDETERGGTGFEGQDS